MAIVNLFMAVYSVNIYNTEECQGKDVKVIIKVSLSTHIHQCNVRLLQWYGIQISRRSL